MQRNENITVHVGPTSPPRRSLPTPEALAHRFTRSCGDMQSFFNGRQGSTPLSTSPLGFSHCVCTDKPTAVCFSEDHPSGTKVWLPKIHIIHPDVDFESARSPENSSRNNPNLQCDAVFPTWQYCLYLLVSRVYRVFRLSRTLPKE